MVNTEELKHVLTRIGDVMDPEEVDAFMKIIDWSGDGFIRMDDMVKLFNPQTDRGSLLTKTID